MGFPVPRNNPPADTPQERKSESTPRPARRGDTMETGCTWRRPCAERIPPYLHRRTAAPNYNRSAGLMGRMVMNSLADDYRKAQRLLSRRDPGLRQLMKAVGPCTLLSDPDGFRALARALIAQQISTKAAASIFARLGTELAPGGLTPDAILAASGEQLRGVGLSRGKALAVLDLAEHIQSGRLPLHDLHR